MSDLQIQQTVSRLAVPYIPMGASAEFSANVVPVVTEPHFGSAWIGHTTAAVRPATVVVIGVSSPALLCGLEVLVQSVAGVRLGGAASRLDAVLEHCAQAGDCVVLVDPLIGGDAARFMASLKGAAPRAQAVLIAEAHPPQSVREALKAGARGFQPVRRPG
jgi:hypothetical protein